VEGNSEAPSRNHFCRGKNQ